MKPGHENDYGFAAGMGLWRGAHLSLSGSSQKLRSQREWQCPGSASE